MEVPLDVLQEENLDRYSGTSLLKKELHFSKYLVIQQRILVMYLRSLMLHEQRWLVFLFRFLYSEFVPVGT